MKVTDWENLFKIRIAPAARANPKAMLNHETLKLLIVLKIIEKYKKYRNMIKVYTEHELDNGLVVDVYFENFKTKDAIAYEIQKDYSEKWLINKTNKFKDYNVAFFKTFDWIPIDLNEFTDDISEIWEKLGDYI